MLSVLLYLANNSSEDATNGCNHDRSYKTKVAIIAFDKRIHFFNLSSSLETTQISVSPDLEDPLFHSVKGCLWTLKSRFVIEDALNYIENLASRDRVSDSNHVFCCLSYSKYVFRFVWRWENYFVIK